MLLKVVSEPPAQRLVREQNQIAEQLRQAMPRRRSA
jgi:hypothetical protein